MSKHTRTILATFLVAGAILVLFGVIEHYATERNAAERSSQASSEPRCGWAQLRADETPVGAIVRTVKEMRDKGAFGHGRVLIDLDNADEAGRLWFANANAGKNGLPPGAFTRFCTTNLHITQVGFSELD